MSDDRPSEKSGADVPSASEVLEEARKASPSADQARRNQRKYTFRFSRYSIGSQEEYEHLIGIRDHYKHRRIWSYVLLFVIGAMIAFPALLLSNVGSGKWNFTEYDWLLPILLVQNLGQVVGLAFVVVKSLFR